MKVTGLSVLDKYIKRNKQLAESFSKWVEILKQSNWSSSVDIKKTFADADTINKNVYIFNIKSNRSLCMVFFEDDEIEIIWVGNHDGYNRKFNSKKKILKFLKNKGYE